MIETAAGLANVSAIAATSGLSMLFVGPMDLSLALGMKPNQLLADMSVGSPLRLIAEACVQSGIIAGAYAGSSQRVQPLQDLGYTWIASHTDCGLLRAGAESASALNRQKAS
jgi:4-hydroxy-2-oxoheptanedioate aldolase